jgi:hypothetical protein
MPGEGWLGEAAFNNRNIGGCNEYAQFKQVSSSNYLEYKCYDSSSTLTYNHSYTADTFPEVTVALRFHPVGGWTAWYNGDLVNDFSSTTVKTSSAGSDRSVGFGTSASNWAAHDWLGIWGRALSDDELNQMHHDIGFTPMTPVKKVFYSIAAAATSTTIKGLRRRRW